MAGERAYRGVAVRRAVRQPEAAVLLLHGGFERGMRRPGRLLNGPSWRMRPFVRALARGTAGRRLLIAEVRYRHRGWNGGRADAARDAVESVAELRARLGPGVPLVLVGHSMGGRAALRAVGESGVTGAVLLAPWCPPDDPVPDAGGRRLIVVHARADRITSPDGSFEAAARARAAGAEVCRYELAGGDHAMLREAAVWHRLTAESAAGLLGLAPLPPEVVSAFALPAGSTEGLALPVTGSALVMEP